MAGDNHNHEPKQWCLSTCPVWQAQSLKDRLEAYFLREEIEEFAAEWLKTHPHPELEWDQNPPNPIPTKDP